MHNELDDNDNIWAVTKKRTKATTKQNFKSKSEL